MPLNLADLMAKTFTYDDALDELCRLVDDQHCTPNCLFALEPEGVCVCRCEGTWHGEARRRGAL